MKKSILTLAASAWIAGAMLTGCNTPASKVENAKDNVRAANQELDEAREEYLADIESYRKETALRIAANEKSIAEFNARMESKKRDADDDYQKKIAALEQKNSDMKKKMDDYKAEGKEKWQAFKADFNRGMEQIGQAFQDLAAKKGE